MIAGHELRRTVRSVGAPMTAVALTVYFLLNAFQGDGGVLRLIELDREIAHAEVQLAEIDARRTAVETRARGLRSARLDLDYLDERTRVMTGFLHPNDLVLSGIRGAGTIGEAQAVFRLPRDLSK